MDNDHCRRAGGITDAKPEARLSARPLPRRAELNMTVPMQKPPSSTIFAIACIMVGAVACAYHAGRELVASSIPVDRPYTRHNTVQGEACRVTILYVLGLPGDASARLAKQRALSEARDGVDGLVDISHDTRVSDFVLFQRHCTVVTGDPISFNTAEEGWRDERFDAQSYRPSNSPRESRPEPPRPSKPGELGGYCRGGNRCDGDLECDLTTERCVEATDSTDPAEATEDSESPPGTDGQ